MLEYESKLKQNFLKEEQTKAAQAVADREERVQKKTTAEEEKR